MSVKAEMIGNVKSKKSLEVLNSEGSFELLQKSYAIARRMKTDNILFGRNLRRAILNLSIEILENTDKNSEIKDDI